MSTVPLTQCPSFLNFVFTHLNALDGGAYKDKVNPDCPRTSAYLTFVYPIVDAKIIFLVVNLLLYSVSFLRVLRIFAYTWLSDKKKIKLKMCGDL